MAEYTEYLDHNGQRIKVSSGISGGKYWITCRVKKSGSLQRVKSKFLPERLTREDAQDDLDRYANQANWRKAEADTMAPLGLADE